MKKLPLLLLFLTLRFSSFAWGPLGHNIIAEIAMDNLDKSVKDSVQKYLGDMTIEQASTWMDDMRKDHSYDYMKLGTSLTSKRMLPTLKQRTKISLTNSNLLSNN